MDKYDVVVLLGSQVKRKNGYYDLAPHTKLKARAGAFALESGITEKMIISGGYNFGVRYNDTDVFKTPEKPNFSFEAFAMARITAKSEAEIIAEYIGTTAATGAENLRWNMFLEELSATTEENADFVSILLKRTPAFEGVMNVGILTLLYHMEKSLPIFQEKITNKNVVPLFAENLLVRENATNIDEVCQYYSSQKGGKQWDVERIRALLLQGQSLAEMLVE